MSSLCPPTTPLNEKEKDDIFNWEEHLITVGQREAEERAYILEVEE